MQGILASRCDRADHQRFPGPARAVAGYCAVLTSLPRSRNVARHTLTFAQYLKFRLGSKGGRAAWFNFFIKPFGASSFAEFWRRWNPVYGYFLYYYSYRPLSRIMPRQGAMMATFLLCGFLLHDLPAWAFTRRVLPPGATIAFSLFGIGAILSGTFHMDLSRRPFALRALVNAGYLVACVAAMLLIIRLFV